MLQVRCTNCGSTAIVPDGTGEFCKCEACGSTFFVAKANAFSKVQLDHTHDVRAWREYLAKQLRLQQESNKARDYGGVKLFAQKILSVLPDDFCAMYYVALAERYDDNDTAFSHFLCNSDFSTVTPDEMKEVVDSLVATVEPKYLDDVKAFIARAYPDTYSSYDAALERNVKNHIQKLKLAAVGERDVFICHRTAAPDQDVADAICTRLEERGLRCWIAPRNILAGSQNYERDIIKGVENCRLFLFVSSFKSIYSEDCETELRAAVLADKVLYSYRIDDTEYDGTFKRALSQVQWLDAIDDPYAHLEQLVIDIKGMLAEDEREKAELEEKRLAAREKERRLLEEQRARDKERLERLEKIVSGGTVSAAPTYNYRSRLKRAEIEVDSGNYDRAVDIIDEVLDSDPENALAWWLLLLCDYRVQNDAALVATGKDFTANANYKNAERFADTAVKHRIDDATADCNKRIVKAVTAVLDEADRYFEIEDFNALTVALNKCAYAFFDEDGLIFERFPDVASRYYWLRLWAKYGQTPLVCVEDITREREYKTALRYASPAQKAEYGRVRSTVSKNARLFLRERSKNRANDGKLVDYLIDNKNILPIDTYHYYSSLLYYRKMLSQLNLTEAQLRNTAIDLSTNEYFMLAQSMATPEQKIAYDELAATLDNNRENKFKSAAEIKAKQNDGQKPVVAERPTSRIVRIVFTVLTAVAAYALFLTAVILFVEFIEDDYHFGLLYYHGEAYDELYSMMICFLLSAVFRIACEGCVIAAPQGKKPSALTFINLALCVITLPLMASLSFILGYVNMATPVFVLTFVGFAVCGISLSKNKTKKR
ncbi:MAG: TIR domain-containing protein [Clostridiales bacterium]|nr:TIR domain-containing protein [Clostridiales bacterium]